MSDVATQKEFVSVLICLGDALRSK